MICQQTTDWIWETVHPEEPSQSSMAAHLESCEVCKGELDARRSVSLRLRDLRKDEGSDPGPGLDRMVLDAAAAAAAARDSGDYGTLLPEVQDEFAEGMGASLTDEMRAMMSGDFAALQSFEDISDEIAESIAEEYGAEIAALTTGRLQVTDGPPPETLPQSPRAVPKLSRDGGQTNPSTGPTPRRKLLVAALVLGAASSGFLVGRLTAPQTSWISVAPPTSQATSIGEQESTPDVDSSAESRPGR